MGVGGGPPGGMAMGYPSSNGTGLGGIPPGSSYGSVPTRPANLGGMPPSARSPGAAMPGAGLPLGMARMQPNGLQAQPNGMSPSPVNGLPPSVSPQGGGLGPTGPSAPGIPTAQLQAYPHLAGAAGFSTSQPSIYGGASSLGSSPYSTQPLTSSYPVSTLGPSMALSGAPMQSPYGSLSSPASTLPGPGGMGGSYPGGLTSYPSAMPSVVGPSPVAPSAYGLSGLRGPTSATPGTYPGMSLGGGSTQVGGYPGQPPSNPGMIRATPIVPTPAYPSTNPYGRPL